MATEDFKIWKDYTWTLNSPEGCGCSTEGWKVFRGEHMDIDDELSAHITGTTIYNDGEVAIMVVKEMTKGLFPFTLFYNEVKNRFPDVVVEGDDPYRRFLCLDIASRTSLFFYDMESGCRADAVYDERGALDYYDLPEGEVEMPALWGDEAALTEEVTLQLPMEEIKQLERMEAIASKEDMDRVNEKGELKVDDRCSVHRAVTWFNTRDCAILTAWRQGKNRRTNDENNRELQMKLREMGYGVTKITGWYQEKDREMARENSFLTVNLNDEEDFKDRIYELSEGYEQDSFLYKKAGADMPAVYVYTNDDCGKGREVLLGRLRIGNMDAEAYSQIKAGRITFDK